MRRRLIAATIAGVAAAVLTACGNMHPGAAIVIDDGDYRVSMDELDDLTSAMCEATQIAAETSGQPRQTSEGIEGRQYVTGLLIQSYLTQQAAGDTGAAEPAPDDIAVRPDDYTDLTDQMDEDQVDDFMQLLELSQEVTAWQTSIGQSLPTESQAGNPAQAGQKYVFDTIDQYDIDVDPRLGIDGEDLLAQDLPRSGSISVAQSSQATMREDASKSKDVVESLPEAQTCG
ncbi:MAG TPA: hypothetical protein VEX15_09460 [Nocardioidaceae bacterium]|nr:hypothetical protein [Nocardioidaceae bacterium]